MKDIAGKIKYYQDDNLRLSSELVKLSSKLENTKNQLQYFENNKAKLVSQLENLNNIISESNVIGSPFGSTKPKIEDKSEKDEKISNEKQVNFGNIKNPEEINRLTKEIFKKSSS